MPVLTVVPQFVNPPRDGKTLADIKADGKSYKFDPGKFSFKQGSTYVIEYTDNEYEGRIWRKITKATERATVPPVGASPSKQPIEIFVTGVIGRCFQGTGNLPSQRELASLIRNLRLAWALGMSTRPLDGDDDDDGPPDDQPGDPGPQSASDYLGDDIPF